MKKVLALLLLVLMTFSIIGCGSSRSQTDDEECQELEYEIVDNDDISQKVKEEMFKRKEKAYYFAYGDGNDMYIAIGYGKKPTGGYSIKILSVEQCGENVIVKTELIKPAKEDPVATGDTYPSIVIKTADLGLKVEVHTK